MKQLTRNLIITYSNQKARELKRSGMFKPFDEVTTLSQLITDTFEKQILSGSSTIRWARRSCIILFRVRR